MTQCNGKHMLGLFEVQLIIWSVPVSSKEDDRVWTNKGERKGGPKPLLARSLWHVFPSPEFAKHPALVAQPLDPPLSRCRVSLYL